MKYLTHGLTGTRSLGNIPSLTASSEGCPLPLCSSYKLNLSVHSGAYASVLLAIDHTAHRQAACKTIVRKTQADIADVLKEVQLLKRLDHVCPNPILTHYTYTLFPSSPISMQFSTLKPRGSICRCDTPEKAPAPTFSIRFIFLELATGGDLFSYMAKNGTLCDGEAKFISYQLIKGLDVS